MQGGVTVQARKADQRAAENHTVWGQQGQLRVARSLDEQRQRVGSASAIDAGSGLSGEGVEDEADQTQQEQEQDRMCTASRWRRLVATTLARDQEGELLLRATAEQATITMHSVPARMVQRVADLFRDQLEVMVRTQRGASAWPGPATCRETPVSQRWVWLLPTRLLRRVPAGGDAAESGMRKVTREGHNQRKQDHEVYLRVKRAERGDWIGLLRHYVDEMEAGKQHESQVMLSAWRLAE